MGWTVFAVTIYAIWFAFIDLDAFLEELKTFRMWTFGAALALVLAGYLFRAWRWHLYLGWLGHPVSGSTSFLTFMSGFAMGITPGKIGELVKTYYLQERSGTPYPRSLAACVAERAADLVALALLLSAGFLSVPGLGFLPVALTFLGALVALAILRSERAAEPIFRLLERPRLLRGGVAHLRSIQQSLRTLLGGRGLAVGVLVAMASWSIEVWAMWLLARGFGLDLTWSACAFVFASATLAGVLSMLPGGLGATEGGMIGLLMYLDVPIASATALTLATRLATLWFSVLLGAACVIILRFTQASTPVKNAPSESG